MKTGLQTFKRPVPLRLSEWAEENFYLSSESSYVQGRWEAYPYQIAIMDCIGHDDIREVTLIKSARVGFTKIILAAMGYFAEHKRRNQCVWQPVDDDADEFVKTEIDTMIRDVPAMRRIFPWYDSRSKHNTLRQKTFAGSILHIRGGRAAKNYRRLSLDVGFIDEMDGFEPDVESEGSPDTLAGKRLEGATFPKLVCGSTPKLAATSLISARAKMAQRLFHYHIPCPHCRTLQPLLFGGKHEAHGFKWSKDAHETVTYVCAACGKPFTQSDYLNIWDTEHGARWQDDKGVWIDPDARFVNADGDFIDPPKSIAFHIWTAYSPQQTWSGIVSDFLSAQIDQTRLRTFVNTTLGEVWEDPSEKTDPASLMARRENYTLGALPQDILYLTAGVDTQDDRLECEIIGWRQDGSDSPPESWGVEYRVFNGDPARTVVWEELDKFLLSQWKTENGRSLTVGAACVDSAGHHTAQVYAFCEARKGRHIYAIKGLGGSRPIWKGVAIKSRKYHAQVWHVGSDTGKDAWYSRLRITDKGHGYCHFPAYYDQVFFNGLTSEQVRTKYVKGRPIREWFVPSNKRNEPLDCRVYGLAALLSRHVPWASLAEAAGLPLINVQAPKAIKRKPSSWL